MAVGKLGALFAKLVGKYGDDAARLVANYGDDVARGVANYGDDAARIIANNADDVAKSSHILGKIGSNPSKNMDYDYIFRDYSPYDPRPGVGDITKLNDNLPIHEYFDDGGFDDLPTHIIEQKIPHSKPPIYAGRRETRESLLDNMQYADFLKNNPDYANSVFASNPVTLKDFAALSRERSRLRHTPIEDLLPF